MKDLRIIRLLAINSFQQMLESWNVFLIFFMGKILRYGLFLSFLYFLLTGISTLGGYSREQILLFYLVFNLIDTLAQLLFREVYRFRPLIVSGGFDAVLAKPMNPLVRVLFGGPDFIDLGILIILLVVMGWVMVNYIHPQIISLLVFVLLIFNSLLIAAAFHIMVMGIGILTLSVDHLIMIYRDLTNLVRIPVDVFTDPLRSILTFVIPVGIMFTFPAKFLFGFLSWRLVAVSFGFGILTLCLSLKFWRYALTQYQSASS